MCLLIAAFYCLITAEICQMLDAWTAATNSDRSPLSAFCLPFVSDSARNMRAGLGGPGIMRASEVTKRSPVKCVLGAKLRDAGGGKWKN